MWLAYGQPRMTVTLPLPPQGAVVTTCSHQLGNSEVVSPGKGQIQGQAGLGNSRFQLLAYGTGECPVLLRKSK